jgi:hypothetical protein
LYRGRRLVSTPLQYAVADAALTSLQPKGKLSEQDWRLRHARFGVAISSGRVRRYG